MAGKLNPLAQYQNQWNVKCDKVRYMISIQSPKMLFFRKTNSSLQQYILNIMD